MGSYALRSSEARFDETLPPWSSALDVPQDGAAKRLEIPYKVFKLNNYFLTPKFQPPFQSPVNRTLSFPAQPTMLIALRTIRRSDDLRHQLPERTILALAPVVSQFEI